MPMPAKPPPVTEPEVPPAACDEDAGACPETQPVLDISTMCSNTCALLQDGSVKCWGVDYSKPYPQPSILPTRVANLENATQISTGCTNSCALIRDGSVRCWGNGRLGDGRDEASSAAVVVQGIQDATAIAVGDGHHCAVIRDGSLHCWGNNGFGSLGDGTMGSQLVPTTASGLHDVARIATGFAMSYAWTRDGALYAWGDQSVNLGIEQSQTAQQSTPARASMLGEVSQLALGYGHRCLVRPDNAVLCWGYNFEGQLGRGTQDSSPPPLHTTPEPVSGLEDLKLIEAGFDYTCAVVGDGAVRCWGKNAHGQLGDGTQTSRSTPTPVVGLRDVRRLALGIDHSCALRADHTVVCWGSNADRRLGADREGDSLTPVAVPGL